MLDKRIWRDYVLVRMAAYLGIFTDNKNYYDSLPAKWLEPGEGGRRVLSAGIYPQKPAMSRQDWEQIRQWILTNAPDKLNGPAYPYVLTTGLKLFEPKPLLQGSPYEAAVTAVHISPERKKLYASFMQQDLLELTPDGKLSTSLGSNEIIVFIHADEHQITLANIGNIVGADNPIGWVKTGKYLKSIAKGQNLKVFDKLMRPVNAKWADLDKDGDEDMVLCEFGNFLGALSWYENDGRGNFERNPIFEDDGATSVHIHDFNGDGFMDLVAVMANADEGIDLYLNQGSKGSGFIRKRLFRFPPTYGSTGLELVDFDKDGLMDLLYLNGDNADYPAILKPHHGLRLFRNTGNMQFEEAFFLPMNGAYMARPADYDQDGDIDIAAVSFYPDYNLNPWESFVYFENQGNYTFAATTFPAANLSRWMVIDAGDADGDGDIDIILGAFNAKGSEVTIPAHEGWKKANTALMFLENKLN